MLGRGAFVLTCMIFLLAVVGSASANIVVFESYDTKATIKDNTILIERDIQMKNVGQNPVIPGELHFRLFEMDGDKRVPLPVTNFQAQSDRGEKLESVIFERDRETDLSIQVWSPLLPGFHYNFKMSYEMQFEPSGIFFHEITLPREETTIAIRRETTQVNLDDSYHVTYAPGSEVTSLSGFSVISWKDAEDLRVVEFSKLPFPRIGIRAVNVFWLIVIILLIGVLVLSTRRRSGKKEPPQQVYYQQSARQPPPQYQQRPPNYQMPPGRR